MEGDGSQWRAAILIGRKKAMIVQTPSSQSLCPLAQSMSDRDYSEAVICCDCSACFVHIVSRCVSEEQTPRFLSSNFGLSSGVLNGKALGFS